MNIVLDKCISKNIIAAKLWIEDGSRADPKDKKGIHQILSSTMLRGCGPYNNEEIAEIVESAGANLNCDTYEDGLLISLKCIKTDADKLLPLIGWMITEPSLEIDQIELEKDLTIKALNRQKESTYQLAFDGWRKMIYKDGPYGHDSLGTIDNIKKIKREHILEIANSFIYRNKNLVISGDFNESIENQIRNLNAFQSISSDIIDKNQTKVSKTKLELLYKKKSDFCYRSIPTEQVILLLGKATITYKNKDDILLRLLSCYLGYGMSSLLFKVLREKYGVVYETGIYHPIRENQTPFIMHASTTEGKAILTVKLLKECWEDVIESEILDEDLSLLKIKYRGQIAHSLQSISQRAEHKAHLLGLGLTKNHDEEILLRLEKITSKDIKNAARKYLREPSLSICSNKKVVEKVRKGWYT